MGTQDTGEWGHRTQVNGDTGNRTQDAGEWGQRKQVNGDKGNR